MATINVTLNPNDMKAGAGTLSNNNLTFTISQAQANIRATNGKTSGKWYWEVKLVSGENGVLIGVANKTYPINSTSLAGTSGDALNIRGYIAGYKEPENVVYGSTIAVGDVVGVALDLDNQKLEFLRNGVSMGVSHTNLAGLGELFPFISSNSALSKVITVNFGASAFTYSVPNGYKAYDTPPVNKFLISSGDGEYVSILNEKYSDNVVPTMNSNTSPSGVASADVETSPAWQAFDSSSTTFWAKSSGAPTWLKYDFGAGNEKIITKYSITTYTLDVLSNPKSWTFEGSNTGLFAGEQIVLDSRSNISWLSTEIEKVFLFSNFQKFRFYRINIALNGYGTASSYVRICGLKMMEKLNNDSVVNMKSLTESNFIKYGNDKSASIDLSKSFMNKVYVEDQNIALGSGKVFKKSIDTSTKPIKKVSIT